MGESSLSRVRKRIGAKFFKELEDKTYRVLMERKIIRGKGLLVDATVYPEAIRYPTDAGLLNRAREWLVKKIDEIGKGVGKRPRTYKRKARQEHIVSLHKPEVRPIVRGKAGKKVEFGPKVALSHVDGYAFLDHMSHDNFNEAGLLKDQVEL